MNSGCVLLGLSFLKSSHHTVRKPSSNLETWCVSILADSLLWSECFCPPKSGRWNPNPQRDDIWRWGLWKVIRFRWGHGGGWGFPHDGISALLRRGRDAKASPLCHDGAQREDQKRAHTRSQICWHLDLVLPSIRTGRKKYLLFNQPSLWCSVIVGCAD